MKYLSTLRKTAIAALLSACLGATSAHADDHGNTFATATAIPAENPAYRDFAGTLEIAGDVDTFAFTVTETTMVWIHTTGTTDTYLKLYNSSETRLGYDNNSGAGNNASIFRTGGYRLVPGTYFVDIQSGGSYSRPQTGSYTLSIRTQGNATTFNTPNLTDSFDVAGEVDLFQVQITDQTMLWLYTTGSTDTHLTLYNSFGTRLSYNNNSGSGYNASIFRTGAYRLTPGTYFIAVEAGGSNGQPQTGSYTMSIRTQSNAATFNTPNRTASLAVNGEVDLFRVKITQNTMLWLYTTGTTDTHINLYNSFGTRLSYNNNSGSGYNASIFRTGAHRLAPGTYFISVEAGGSYGRPQTGTYTLSIRTQTNAMTFNTPDASRSLGVLGDIDLYRIDVRKSGRCLFFTTGEADTYISVYDTNGTSVSYDNNSGASYNAYLSLILDVGTYYVAIKAGGYSNQPQTGAYRVSVRLPGNAIALTGKDKLSRSISPRGDVEQFVLTTRGGTVDLQSTGRIDTYASLYRADGQLVVSDNNSGKGGRNFRIKTKLPRGTYYLVVSGASLDSVIGRYTLKTKFRSPAITVPAVDQLTAGFLKQTLPVGIRSNTKWKVSEKSSWIKVSPKKGKGNGTIKLKISANRGNARSATVKIGGKTLLVRQAARSAASPSDWNGDAAPDLLVTHAATGETATWSVANGNLTSAEISPAPATSFQLVNHGDFTGDATPDTVWQDPATGDIAIRDGDGELKSINRQPGSPRWQVVANGNFGAATGREIVLQNRDTGTLRLWTISRSLSVTATGAPSHQPAGSGWSVVAAGDADGDSHADLFFRHRNGQLHLWFMDGRDVVASGALTRQPASGTWLPCASADFNGDGKADLVLQHATTRKVTVWHLDGRVVTGARDLGKQPVGIAWEISNSRPR